MYIDDSFLLDGMSEQENRLEGGKAEKLTVLKLGLGLAQGLVTVLG